MPRQGQREGQRAALKLAYSVARTARGHGLLTTAPRHVTSKQGACSEVDTIIETAQVAKVDGREPAHPCRRHQGRQLQ